MELDIENLTDYLFASLNFLRKRHTAKKICAFISLQIYVLMQSQYIVS